MLFVGIGGVTLLLLNAMDDEETTEPRSLEKESQFLTMNNDQIYINMLHAEEHLRTISGKPIAIEKGEASCVVKHLASAEGHASEAVSHSADLKATMKPEEYRELEQNLQGLRHEFQTGDLTANQALVELRDIRRNNFEKHNPAFDISKCKACLLEDKSRGEIE